MATIFTNDADAYFSQDGNDEVFGLGGDDFIATGAGNDTICGGTGNDTLVGSTGLDKLYGGSGTDTASYSFASSGIEADLTDGTVKVAALDIDQLSSIENLTGSQHTDTLIGNSVGNTFHGLSGHDELFGGGGNDSLHGGDGNDHLTGGTGGDRLNGGDGFDRAYYIAASDGINVNLATGSGIAGEALGDTLVGIEDVMGSMHNDMITGDSNDNVLLGIAGDDLLQGLGGRDLLNGSGGNDTLSGGSGDDTVLGGDGADHHDGGSGDDMTSYYDSFAAVEIDLLANTGKGGHAEGDTFSAIETFTGSAFDDILRGDDLGNVLGGSAGNDTVNGRNGADQLEGNDGRDVIVGGQGNDTITGGADQDVMRGQAGQDMFSFLSASDSGTTLETFDVIKDFASGQDSVNLAGIDARSTTFGSNMFTFIGNGGFGGVEGELRFFDVGQKTFIEGDINGDAVADFKIRFDTHVDFTANDFIL